MSQLQLATEGEINILAFGDSLTEGSVSPWTTPPRPRHEANISFRSYTDWGMTFHPYAHALRKSLSAFFPDRAVTVDVNGQSGDFVLADFHGNFLPRLRKSLARIAERGKAYDLVIVLGGTNDLAMLQHDSDAAPDRIFTGLRACYDCALAAGAALLILTVPERSADHSARHRHVREARERLNARLLGYAAERAAEVPRRVFLMDLAAMAPFPEVPDGEDQHDFSGWEGQLWSPDGLHMSAHGYDFVGEELAALIHHLLVEENGADESIGADEPTV